MTDTDRIAWQGRFLEMHIADHGPLRHWEYVKRTRGVEAAVILALTDAGEVVLVEQYRAPLRCSCIEFPAGLVGDEVDGEEPGVSARRELIEETGFDAERWEPLGAFASSPGMVGEIFHLFRASGLRRVGPGGGVDGEGIVVHVVPLRDIPMFIAGARARGCMIDTRLLTLLSLV